MLLAFQARHLGFMSIFRTIRLRGKGKWRQHLQIRGGGRLTPAKAGSGPLWDLCREGERQCQDHPSSSSALRASPRELGPHLHILLQEQRAVLPADRLHHQVWEEPTQQDVGAGERPVEIQATTQQRLLGRGRRGGRGKKGRAELHIRPPTLVGLHLFWDHKQQLTVLSSELMF